MNAHQNLKLKKNLKSATLSILLKNAHFMLPTTNDTTNFIKEFVKTQEVTTIHKIRQTPEELSKFAYCPNIYTVDAMLLDAPLSSLKCLLLFIPFQCISLLNIPSYHRLCSCLEYYTQTVSI